MTSTTMSSDNPMWEVTARTIVYAAIGAALYAVAAQFQFLLPGTANVSLRPGFAIVTFFGFAFGPVVGLFVGLVGNAIADQISGWGLLTSWNWSVANGLVGLLAGIFAYSLGGVLPNRIIRSPVAAALAIVIGFLFVFTDIFLGTADDRWKLSPRLKLLVETLVATGFVVGGERLSLFMEGSPAGDIVGGAITVAWIVGITNAFNLLDHMDGLTGGVTLLTCTAFAIVAGVTGQWFVAAAHLVKARDLAHDGKLAPQVVGHRRAPGLVVGEGLEALLSESDDREEALRIVRHRLGRLIDVEVLVLAGHVGRHLTAAADRPGHRIRHERGDEDQQEHPAVAKRRRRNFPFLSQIVVQRSADLVHATGEEVEIGSDANHRTFAFEQTNHFGQLGATDAELFFDFPQVRRRQRLGAEDRLDALHERFFLGSKLDPMLRQAQQIFFFDDGSFLDQDIYQCTKHLLRHRVTELRPQLFHIHARNQWMARMKFTKPPENRLL